MTEYVKKSESFAFSEGIICRNAETKAAMNATCRYSRRFFGFVYWDALARYAASFLPANGI
jgi:hypothetical protein